MPVLSSVARKNLMALTGLFLCVFLAIHVLGNLPLLFPQETGQLPFNRYAAFLTGLTVIKIASLVTMAAVLAHSLLAVVLTLRSRGTDAAGYAVKPARSTSPLYSRVMGVTGGIVLLFLVVHLWDYWYPYKFGGDAVGTDSAGHRDLYSIVATSSRRWWHVLFYVVCMVAVGFHLVHGVYSAFRSMGLYQSGLARAARGVGIAFAIVVSVLFAAMPVYLFFTFR